MKNNLEEMFAIKGKIALVTGGAGYLGFEICSALAEQGANIIIASRDQKKCQDKCYELKEKYSGINAYAIELDLMSKDSIKKTFAYIENEWNGLDILVNNAWSGKKNSFESITDDDWEYDIDMSLNSVFYCVKNAVEGLKNKKGVILNVASMYGHIAPDYRLYDGIHLTNPPSYGAAKAGVIQFTKYLASFLSPYEIRVNCISPGAFPHEVTQKNDAEFIKKLSVKAPLNRIGQPHEIKGTVALLCSDASSFITGQNICIDGGWGIW